MSDWRDRTAELPIITYQLAATIACHQPPAMPVARSPWGRIAGWLFVAGVWGAVVVVVMLKEGLS